MKVGDRLYCYCNSNDGVDIDCTIGVFYIIENISFDNRLIIVNNIANDWFSYDDNNSLWYYGNWFYSNQELRKFKLDLLKSVDTL